MNAEKYNTVPKLNVLVLEDSHRDVELVHEQLLQAGFQHDLTHVEDEAGYIAALRNNRFHLILSDFRLPGFDAFGALKISRELCPDTPFICVSGTIGEETAVELLKRGAVDYVLKNKPEKIPYAVKRALEEAKLKVDYQKTVDALRQSEEKFRSLADTAKVMIGIVEDSTGSNYLYVNQEWERITGYTKEEAQHLKPIDLAAPEHREEVLKNATKRFAGKYAPITYELKIITKSGEVRYLDFSSKIINFGNKTAFLTTGIDITDRKRAQEDANRREKILNKIFDILPIGLWFADKDGKLLRGNPAGISIWGGEPKLPIDEYGIFKGRRLPSREEIQPHDWALAHSIRKKATISDELMEIDAFDGKKKTILNYTAPVLDDNNDILGAIVVNIDITEREKMLEELIEAKENAQKSDKLKSAFINNISHEIRTPLNGILGFGALLTETDPSPEDKREMLQRVQQSSDRLLNTVSDYIDIARIVSGTLEMQKKEFLLQHLFDEIIRKNRLLFADTKLNFVTDFQESDTDIVINSDSEFIAKIMDIFLNNALKFTTNGSVSCGYRLNEGFIEFFVKDTGRGIAPDMLDEIFTMFTQEDTSDTRGHEGSGIGLSIASGLIKLLGGKISVTSEKGKGSTFAFTIPYESKSPTEKTPFETRGSSTPDKGKPLILVAEDEESNAFYIMAALKMAGFDYLLAKNGKEAVDLCKQNPGIKLVLMDIKMPLMNGLDATRFIREFRPDLPVIATTAYAQTGDEQRFLAAGCDGYLVKPFRTESLLAILKKYSDPTR